MSGGVTGTDGIPPIPSSGAPMSYMNEAYQTHHNMSSNPLLSSPQDVLLGSSSLIPDLPIHMNTMNAPTNMSITMQGNLHMPSNESIGPHAVSLNQEVEQKHHHQVLHHQQEPEGKGPVRNIFHSSASDLSPSMNTTILPFPSKDIHGSNINQNNGSFTSNDATTSVYANVLANGTTCTHSTSTLQPPLHANIQSVEHLSKVTEPQSLVGSSSTNNEVTIFGACRVCKRTQEQDPRTMVHFKPTPTAPSDIFLHVFCGKTAVILPTNPQPQYEILLKAGLKNKHGIGPDVNFALSRTRSALAFGGEAEKDPKKVEKEYYLVKEFEAHLHAIRDHQHQNQQQANSALALSSTSTATTAVSVSALPNGAYGKYDPPAPGPIRDSSSVAMSAPAPTPTTNSHGAMLAAPSPYSSSHGHHPLQTSSQQSSTISYPLAAPNVSTISKKRKAPIMSPNDWEMSVLSNPTPIQPVATNAVAAAMLSHPAQSLQTVGHIMHTNDHRNWQDPMKNKNPIDWQTGQALSSHQNTPIHGISQTPIYTTNSVVHSYPFETVNNSGVMMEDADTARFLEGAFGSTPSVPAFYSSSKHDPQYQSLGEDSRRGPDNRRIEARSNGVYLDHQSSQGTEELLNVPMVASNVRTEFDMLQEDSLSVRNNDDKSKQSAEQQPSKVMEI
jgi:hypothetical protein